MINYSDEQKNWTFWFLGSKTRINMLSSNDMSKRQDINNNLDI